MNTIKVYELASKKNINSSNILSAAKHCKITINSIRSTLSTDDAKKILLYLKENPTNNKTFEEEIKEAFHNMTTIEDLVNILNTININTFGESVKLLQTKFLTYHAYHSLNKYKEFEIPKKSGGNRIIHAPQRSLNNILRTLNVTLQYIYKVNKSSHGFVKGKSVVTNAMNHIDKGYVYNIDLKDFFTNINQARVWKRLQLPPFNLNGEKMKIANLISSLVCYQNDTGNNFLPQGAPTSPVLSNAICERLDRKLTGLAKRFNVMYSRYADDITFSSNHNVYENNTTDVDTEFIQELKRIIQNENFEINPKKTRLQKRGYRQEVTGITVNNKLNLRKSYIKSIRASIYILEKYGVKKANKIFISNGYLKDSKKNYVLKYISGKLEYLKMVKGADDATYIKLKQRFDKCKNPKTKASVKKEVKVHNPKRLVELLASFTKDNNDLKFTTHNWDLQRYGDRFSSYDDFMDKITKEWNKISKELKSISPKLAAKISTFLFNKYLGEKNVNNKINKWGLNQIEFGWSSPSLKQWCEKNKSPFEYILEDKYRKEINKKTIYNFMDVVDVFKNEIEVRSVEDTLKNIFIKQMKYLGPDFNVTLENLDGVDFYTDVQWFEIGLNNIFEEIKRRAQHPDIKVTVIKNIDLGMVDIHILQGGSLPNKTVDEMLNEIKDGNFEEIYNAFHSLCDWSIETRLVDGDYRINYLDNNFKGIKTKKLSNTPAGFEHILRFYK